jgi:DsbC/DsbD-like thiol-disulfide interchange protein
MRQIITISFCAALVALAACARVDSVSAPATNAPQASPTAQAATTPAAESFPSDPSAGVVSASGEALTIAAGGAGVAIVRVEIAEGFHVNANPPTHSYLIPTEVSIEPADGFTFGRPSYPAPLRRKFSFDPAPLAVYEGETTIRVPLRVARGATPGARTLNARLRAQPCDDRACYQPRTIELSLPVTIN